MKKPRIGETQKAQFAVGYEKGRVYRERLKTLMPRVKNLFGRRKKDV